MRLLEARKVREESRSRVNVCVSVQACSVGWYVCVYAQVCCVHVCDYGGVVCACACVWGGAYQLCTGFARVSCVRGVAGGERVCVQSVAAVL